MEAGGVGPGETQHDIVTAPHPLHILIISCQFPVVTCSFLTYDTKHHIPALYGQSQHL